MAALTSTQYVGDTTFNFVVRVFGTFAGALSTGASISSHPDDTLIWTTLPVGMVVWYIGAGTGRGSAYGIMACAAVALPLSASLPLHLRT